MTKEDLQAELQAKVKAGVKPSDLKKSKSTPVSRQSFNPEKYVLELESEKAEFLKQIANYEKEQKASVKVYHDQEKLLDEKEQQLISKDEELSEQQEQITKLKERIKVLVQEKKDLRELTKNTPQITNISQQTTQTTSTTEWEDQELAKRLELLKKAPSPPPQSNFPTKNRTEIEKNALIIFLLIVLAGSLLFK